MVVSPSSPREAVKYFQLNCPHTEHVHSLFMNRPLETICLAILEILSLVPILLNAT